MIGRSNSFGGLSVNNALLHIIAAAGSTITISKNGIVLRSLEPSAGHVNATTGLADYYYSVPLGSYGDLTVASDRLSKTVSVTENKVYDVNVAIFYLYNRGTFTDLYTAANVTSGASISNATSYIQITGTANSVQDGYKRWAAVDLTYFDTISMIRSAYTATSSTTNYDMYNAIYIATSTSVVNVRQATVKTNTKTTTGLNVESTVKLDISNITGTYYVFVGMNNNGSSWTYGRRQRIHQVWLS